MTDGVFGSVVLKTETLANQMLSRLLVTKCLKIQFKTASLIGRLLSVNTTLVMWVGFLHFYAPSRWRLYT